jgi:hypothetical protein
MIVFDIDEAAKVFSFFIVLDKIGFAHKLHSKYNFGRILFLLFNKLTE